MVGLGVAIRRFVHHCKVQSLRNAITCGLVMGPDHDDFYAAMEAADQLQALALEGWE
jgi:hypothetical protein